LNISNPTSFSSPDITFTTSNSSGTSGALRADDSLLLYDVTVPTTIAASDSAATGDSETAARRNHVHGSAAAYTTFAAPSFTLGTSNISGSGDSVHAGATLLAFDTTAVTSESTADTAAVGSATVASRRDHLHGNLLAFTLARLYGH
jgi:hypothetical protein